MHFFLSVLLDWPLFSAFIFRSLGLFFLFFFNESLHLCVHFLTTTQFLLLSSCNLTVIWLVLNSIEILFFKILPKKSIFFFQSLFSFRIHFWILDALSVEWKLLRLVAKRVTKCKERKLLIWIVKRVTWCPNKFWSRFTIFLKKCQKKVWNFSNYKREQRFKKFENLRILKI